MSLLAIEVGIMSGATDTLSTPVSSTKQIKVLDEQQKPHQLALKLEAEGGSTQRLFLHRKAINAHVTADGALIDRDLLDVKFLEGPWLSDPHSRFGLVTKYG